MQSPQQRFWAQATLALVSHSSWADAPARILFARLRRCFADAARSIWVYGFLALAVVGPQVAHAATKPVIGGTLTATGQTGVAFSYQITASNAPTLYGASPLPAGLAIDTGAGLISGTPTTAARTRVTITATNAGGTDTATLTITINPPPPVITSAATATGQAGVAFSYRITATNTPTSYSATGLPGGLSLDPATGKISGTPTTVAVSTVTVAATNASGTGTATLTITVNPPTPVITSATAATGQTGLAFSYQVVATNGPTSFGATNLPAGLSIDPATGVIGGTPTVVEKPRVTITATNAGGTGTATLTITVNPPPPAITSATTATGQVGVAFSYKIAATNTPTSYSATGLPDGLSLDPATGRISGTPTTVAVSTVTVSATNVTGTGTATLTLTVNPPKPAITSALATTGQTGVSFSYQIAASNSPTLFGASNLPAGLSVDTATGLISGTPTTAGTKRVALSATNAGGTGTATLTITVLPPIPVITSVGRATGRVGDAFNYRITATNHPTSYSATGLPAGLSVDTATGKISGTPTAAGLSTVAIAATNAAGTGAATITLTINPAKPVITSPTTASGTIGVPFSYQITATNTPTSFSTTKLPTGLSLDAATGLISGTPTRNATSNIVIRASNAGGTGSAALKLTIALNVPAITSATTAIGTANQAFSYRITATGKPTAYGATGLPAGLVLNAATGVISGKPISVGTATITLSATNATGTGTRALTLTVNPFKAAAPAFSPKPGTYPTAQSVTITSRTSGVTIRYTTDGSAPSATAGTLYTGPVNVAATSTLRAVACETGYTDSSITTGTYTISVPVPAATPTFSVPTGTYSSAQTVAITTTTPGATIAYTTDGSTPVESGGRVVNGRIYSAPVPIGATTTLNAIAFASGYLDSPVATATYTITSAVPTAPVFSPDPGAYTSVQAITITSTGADAIYYTTDGTEPTTAASLYSQPIPIAANTTLKALATNAAGASPVTSGRYTFTSGAMAGAPVFAAAPGAYADALDVTITSATSDASINYTIDGSTPTETNGIPYSGPVNIGTTTVLKAVAYESGLADSTVTTGLYTITNSPSAALNVVADFSSAPDAGMNPWSGVIQGTDGNFYGTTESGGTAGQGTVFQMNPAGVVKTLVSFAGSNGAYPEAGLVQGSDGNFYGTTAAGGSSGEGTVFRLTPAGVLTTLVSFDGANGSTPEAALVQGSDGNFYGTTQSGGSAGQGTTFVVTPAGVLTTLVSFAGPNGANPAAALVQGRDGRFYGTTQNGGDFGQGTVFTLSPSGTLTTLVSFSGDNGANPAAALVQGRDGNFYGTTAAGTDSGGTAFRMTPSGSLTTVATFGGGGGAAAAAFASAGVTSSASRMNAAAVSSAFAQYGGSGIAPQSSLVQGNDGNFYGTTASGGDFGQGTIFEISTDGTLYTLFSFSGPNGANPYFSGLIQATDGNLYGTTAAGGVSGNGIVYQIIPIPTAVSPVFSPAPGRFAAPTTVAITTTTSGATILYTTDGSIPSQGNGTTYTGPVTISGTTLLNALATGNGLVDSAVTSGVYEINSFVPTYTVLNSTLSTSSGVMQASDGLFYGTTSSGGEFGLGSVFMLDPSGAVTSLYAFSGADGGQPAGRPVPGGNGKLYGTTGIGGSFGYGTVYMMDPSGLLTTLVSFNNTNGAYPTGDLVLGQDGNFYGVTSGGGDSGYGTIFKITPAGGLTSLASFNGQNGSDPMAGLIQGSDGNFYGTTFSGGDWGLGTVFALSPTGAVTTLVSFDWSHGGGPAGALVQGKDGNFYGTTIGGGAFYNGTLFRVTPAGAMTTLASFNYFDGAPWSGLVQGNDGNLYGTTTQGGSFGAGTLFMVTPSGALNLVSFFDNVNGAYPYAPLFQGADGALYGSTSFGGSANSGVIFKVAFPPADAPVFSPAPGSYSAAPTVTLASTATDARIIYTTDGSTPTLTHGLAYAGPVTLSTTATLKAMAIASGHSASAVASGAYTLTTPLAAAPQFSPLPGTYATAQTVTLTSTTGGAAIAYTTDGSTPTEIGGVVTHGTLYAAPVTLNASASTLTAIAFAPNAAYQDSPATSGVYLNANPPLPAPGLSIQGGTYTGSISVTISCPGAQAIYYTTDGTAPTASSLRYGSPVVITANGVLQAIGVNSLGAGSIASASYTILPPAPTFSPTPGTYVGNAPPTVTMSGDASATIYFTLDGSTPTTDSTTYTGPISLPAGVTMVSAVAINANGASAVTSRKYVLAPSLPVAPVFGLPGGTYNGVQSVSIRSDAATAIYYTTDGSTPTAASTRYVGPVSISTSGTLKAIGLNGGGYSPVSSVAYTIVPIPGTPELNVAPGTYSSAQTVSITSVGATAIYYTLNGGLPSSATTLYTGPIVISGNTTLQVVGVNTFGSSTVTSGRYTILSAAGAPVFSPAPASFADAQNVTITTSTAGATIIYTTDGSIPTESNGMTYSGPVSVGRTTMLRAIAFSANAYADSAITSGAYAIGSPAPLLNVLYNFSFAATGGGTCSALVQGPDGCFYGTTSAGGDSNLGTVFKMTGSGVATTLVSFGGANGATPRAGLVLGSDGNFYGTTSAGGGSDRGTIFSLTSGGVLSTLASFTGANGAQPSSALVQASDGNFYGTTATGGSFSCGTVFRVTPAGALTTVFSFDGGIAYFPVGELVQGTDGNLYGTAGNPADGNTSVAFAVTPAGQLNVVATIPGYTVGGLVQGSDGSFYGTTRFGGPDAFEGSVFKFAPTGGVTVLVVFNGSNGAIPRAGLVQGRDGNFYGTTMSGFDGWWGGFGYGPGTVFKMTPDGTMTVVAFDGANGTAPFAGLIQGADGNFYGTAGGGIGGDVGPGVLFQLLAQSASAPVFSPPPGSIPGPESLTITTSTAGATIRYTIDGSTPSETNGTVYSGPVAISGSVFVQAIAYVSGSADSPISSGSYVIVAPVSAPTFNLAAGTYSGAQSVALSSTTPGATIRYTTDGTLPSETSGILYAGPISISSSTTITAIAYEAGFADSGIATATYTIVLPAQPAAAPTFSPTHGANPGENAVIISTASPGASIRYTTDGSPPTETHGTLYAGPVVITAPLTLSAIAYGNGLADSTVTTVTIGKPTISITTPADGSTVP